ncbi:MAG: Rpn family recombination-promoting nuclease/putative transposase, partial [Deltaproteobacteria bacterium]|nr:Rpn family recombination-promoting nuclease/putative transposase [Deltaproteobacteria bacterium]
VRPLRVARRALSIDPTLDPAFKYLFNDPELLMGLLNRVLHLPDHEQITALTYLNTAHGPDHDERRGVIFDLLVTDAQGARYEVEVQRNDKSAQLLRAQYYGAKLLAAQLKEGQGYTELKPVRVIMFTRFDLFPDPHPARTYHPTPYLISAQESHLPLEERRPHLEPFDLSARRHYAHKETLERKQREANAARRLATFTLIELSKDLTPLSASCQRALRALTPPPQGPTPMSPKPAADLALPPDLAEDPWVIAFYERLELFAGSPERVNEYNRTLKELADHVTRARLNREEGREEVLLPAVTALLAAGKTAGEICALLTLTPAERARLLPPP